MRKLASQSSYIQINLKQIKTQNEDLKQIETKNKNQIKTKNKNQIETKDETEMKIKLNAKLSQPRNISCSIYIFSYLYVLINVKLCM